MSNVSGVIKSIQDIMRKDVGVDGDAQRISQLVWMFFLKIYDDREVELELLEDDFKSPLPEELRWRNWAKDSEGITGEDLFKFIDIQLFPTLKKLTVSGDDKKLTKRAKVVRTVFEDAYNYMKSGTLMRQVINKISEIDFNNTEDRHTFGNIYEQLLKDLQSAGNAGEFYTPRAVTSFIVDRVDPKLDESVLDPACGTGGFLTTAVEHKRANYVSSVEDEETLQSSIYGVEKKAMPHMLCVTNMILHGIDTPENIRHGNTLERPYKDYTEKDRKNVIMTNPPFGGTEEDGIENNFPTQLRTRETAGISDEHIEELLSEGKYETVIEEIEEKRGREVFTREIFDVFGKTGTLTDTTFLVSELFTDTLLTTNYDKLIEQASDTGANNLQIITGKNASEQPKADHVTVVKLHGNVEHQNTCILSKNQYDEAYGNDQINMSLPIPKLLEYYYKNSSLFFLGSSLHSDRTVQVFRTIKESLGDVEVPPHFSIEAAPETDEELADRNEYLQRLGITAIWFEKGRFEYIENILRLARNEVRYRGIGEHEVAELIETKKPCILELELFDFLHDFIDLMPLMHWLHRHIPQKETAKYLQSIQRVFYAGSFFIDSADKNLLIGIDNLARALSNKSKFDSYTHEKLLAAFKSFQTYFQSIGKQYHPVNGIEWDIHELLTIPLTQFSSNELTISNPNYHVSRLAITLLNQGLSQRHSPKQYCELPEALNAEMSDYLSVILKSKLGLEIPDRLQNGHTDEIKELCKSAWDHQSELYGESFFQKVLKCCLK